MVQCHAGEQVEPFVNVIQDENGGEVLEGLCIDLLNKLSDKMGFHYTVRLVADGQYGGQLEDGSWTGLVGDLVNHVCIGKQQCIVFEIFIQSVLES